MIDPRNIANGFEIPSEGYCDQPYVIKNPDGSWVCTMTTGKGKEGQLGQHIVATISEDKGKTWSDLIDIEPADGPEASWVSPFITPYGRIYAFYTYNAENMREAIANEEQFEGGKTARVDTLGEYAFKYSDDGGRTWSKDRHYIPVRTFDIDRRNPYGGKIKFFWGVGKPITCNSAMYLGFAKVGHFGHGFMGESEGCFLKSDNILTEKDPEKLSWVTLPEGDYGISSPGEGLVCDEANLTALSDGTLFATCRTIESHPVQAYSRDSGNTWKSAYMEFYPGGPLMGNPRAANFVRRLDEGKHAGKFIYWFHNNNSNDYTAGNRNPAWLTGGVEHESEEGKVIHWGRPEVILYDSNPFTGISYPDFIEDDGKLYITETQKRIARVHEIPDWVLDRLWE